MDLRTHYFRARKNPKFRRMGLIEFAKIQAARTDGKAPFGKPEDWQEWLDKNVKDTTNA